MKFPLAISSWSRFSEMRGFSRYNIYTSSSFQRCNILYVGTLYKNIVLLLNAHFLCFVFEEIKIETDLLLFEGFGLLFYSV